MVRDYQASHSAPSRRRLLQASAAVGGGLLLGLRLPFNAEAADGGQFAPNAFVRIGGGCEIVLIMPYVEMGHLGDRPRHHQCDLCRDWQAPAQVARRFCRARGGLIGARRGRGGRES
jgi:hypothetical protein